MATGQVLFFKAGSCFAPSASLLKIENCARLAIHNNNNNNLFVILFLLYCFSGLCIVLSPPVVYTI